MRLGGGGGGISSFERFCLVSCPFCVCVCGFGLGLGFGILVCWEFCCSEEVVKLQKEVAAVMI